MGGSGSSVLARPGLLFCLLMAVSHRRQSLAFWGQPDLVTRFAARDPDVRLSRLVSQYPTPSKVRVLDLGAAAGRNTVFLAQRGFDVRAIDFSTAMVKETRRRLAEILGEEEAIARVQVGEMDRLDDFEDGSFDLIVALGIYHGAETPEEWDRALAESNRVLARYGHALVANHSDEYDPEGTGLLPVVGQPHVFDGLKSGRSYLIDAATLDQEMERHGFVPTVPTETVRRSTEAGVRVTVNGLYTKT